MLAEISVGVASLKTAFDIAKGMLDISNSADIKGAVIAIQQQLLNAQQAAMDAQAREASLVKTIGGLEAKIARFETWEEEKQRYQLQELPPGMFVYGLKADARGSEPDHKICATCYQTRLKSILHHDEQRNGVMNWHCNTCGFKGQTGHFVPPTVNRRNPEGGGWMSR